MQRDNTEIQQLEQQLRFQKELTEAALNAAPMVVAMVGSDRKVLMDNHAYKALLGDFRGKEPAALFIEAIEQQTGLNISDVCQVGEGFRNIEVRLDPPGSIAPRWFVCSGARVAELDEAHQNYSNKPENARCCLLLIANEVTATRKRVNEAQLNMIRSSMVEQQMAQAMREAISGAIFKLQVPLNVIKAALSMSDNSSERLREVLQQALESGNEAMESLHNSLPRPTSERTSAVNLNEILHEVIKLSMDRLLSSGVVIDWKPATTLPTVLGRANALRGMFKYLIDNAIEAVNEAVSPHREIRLETTVEENELVVTIIDNGPGVKPEQRLKAFEPFFCGWRRAGAHAGMGLTMAQEVAISHGGSVEMDPDFPGGCRLFVRLPVKSAAEGGWHDEA